MDPLPPIWPPLGLRKWRGSLISGCSIITTTSSAHIPQLLSRWPPSSARSCSAQWLCSPHPPSWCTDSPAADTVLHCSTVSSSLRQPGGWHCGSWLLGEARTGHGGSWGNTATVAGYCWRQCWLILNLWNVRKEDWYTIKQTSQNEATPISPNLLPTCTSAIMDKSTPWNDTTLLIKTPNWPEGCLTRREQSTFFFSFSLRGRGNWFVVASNHLS